MPRNVSFANTLTEVHS